MTLDALGMVETKGLVGSVEACPLAYRNPTWYAMGFHN